MQLLPDAARIFDSRQLRRQRRRSLATFAGHDFLFRATAAHLADRLDDITHRFSLAVDLSARGGLLRAALSGRGGIQRLIDCHFGLAAALASPAAERIVADETLLPFADASLDLVLSNLALHWIDDLPGTLTQIRRALRPDGLFLAALSGGETLRELDLALREAELAASGGLSPRLSPRVSLRDAAGLLQRAGFALPVADLEIVTVTYPDLTALMRDLRCMGEGNALLSRRRRPTRRAVFALAEDIYRRRFADAQGRLIASFQIIFLTGWAPHAGQQRPARRGSGRIGLAEALKGARER